MLLPGALEKVKSPGLPKVGLMLTDEIVSVWLPEFVKVTVGAVEEVFTFTLPKLTEVCDKLATG